MTSYTRLRLPNEARSLLAEAYVSSGLIHFSKVGG